MRILMLHNHYQISGGEDESFRTEALMLEQAGHEVLPLVEHNDVVETLGKVRVAAAAVWSWRSYYRVLEVINRWRPDVMHVQNFFPLFSPSVYYAAKKAGVPVVQSLRNYRLICPNALLYRDGGVCESCVGRLLPIPGILNRCYRNSYLGSAVVTAMLVTHRGLGTWNSMVDVYVSLSEFARQKFIESGFCPDRIVVKPNFVYPDPGVGGHKGRFALYVGRLSHEKGLDTLLKAWRKVGEGRVLKIVGDGPLASEVTRFASEASGVEFLGRRPIEEVHELMGQAAVLVFPSEWYEPFGRVAIEAFAKGTPVIASDIGAIAEVVEHGRNGWLFEVGNADALAKQLTYVLDRPHLLRQAGAYARGTYETRYSAKTNLEVLQRVYELARTLSRRTS